MINIFYGEMEKVIYNPLLYFKNTYEDSWITDPLTKEMILDVDSILTKHF